MKLKNDVQYRLASVIGIMLEVARFSESECEEGKGMTIDIGIGGLTLSRHMKDGVKDILTLESLYNSEHELLKWRNELCQSYEKLIYELFSGDFHADEIMELLNDDEKKAIKEIFTSAVIRDREELEKIAREEDKNA